jgi:ferredoxin
MRVTVDREESIACGACYEDCPEAFEEDPDIVDVYRVDDDLAVGQASDDLADYVRTVAEGCPIEGIQVEG